MKYRDYYFVVDSLEEVEALREKYGNIICSKGTPEIKEKEIVDSIEGVERVVRVEAKPAVGDVNKYYVLVRTEKEMKEKAAVADKDIVEELAGRFA